MTCKTTAFDSDLSFCPDCGTVLPLPTTESDYVVCYNKKCGFQLPASAFENIITTSEIDYSQNVQRKLPELPHDFGLGPMVDRKCPQCGNERMVYSTLQMRSADEGQTVFYLCPKCRFRDREDS